MPLILGTNSIKDTGYNVANSLRFNDGSSDYLSRTPSSTGNKQTWTYSAWIKRGTSVASLSVLLGAYLGGSNRYSYIGFSSSEHGQDEIQFFSGNYTTGSSTTIASWINTDAVYRDFSAWYHIVIKCDFTESSASDVIKIYVNNVLQSTRIIESNATVPSNSTFFNTSGIAMQVGSLNAGSFFDGYMAEVCWIDGTALDPTSFGEFDSDSPTIWKPIDVSGLTFGTNGFYLEFEQSGTSQNSSGLGADTSGNDNHFAVNNLTAVDQSIDTCTNNFATGNPIAAQGGSAVSNSLLTFSEGNLLMAANSETGIANFGLSSGKWFWEVKVIADQDGLIIGAVNQHYNLNAELGYNSPASATGAKAFGYYGGNGTATVVIGDGSGFSSYGSAIAVNNIIGVALDLDSADQSCTFYLNGSSQGALDITNLDAGEFYFPAVGNWSVADASTSWNFGSPQFSISSGNSDANGYGNFEYSVPSGYYSINTKNLAEFG
jgi:hypothetical protein